MASSFKAARTVGIHAQYDGRQLLQEVHCFTAAIEGQRRDPGLDNYARTIEVMKLEVEISLDVEPIPAYTRIDSR